MALWKDESPSRDPAPRTEPPKAPEKVAVLSAVSDQATRPAAPTQVRTDASMKESVIAAGLPLAHGVDPDERLPDRRTGRVEHPPGRDERRFHETRRGGIAARGERDGRRQPPEFHPRPANRTPPNGNALREAHIPVKNMRGRGRSG